MINERVNRKSLKLRDREASLRIKKSQSTAVIHDSSKRKRERQPPRDDRTPEQEHKENRPANGQRSGSKSKAKHELERLANRVQFLQALVEQKDGLLRDKESQLREKDRQLQKKVKQLWSMEQRMAAFRLEIVEAKSGLQQAQGMAEVIAKHEQKINHLEREREGQPEVVRLEGVIERLAEDKRRLKRELQEKEHLFKEELARLASKVEQWQGKVRGLRRGDQRERQGREDVVRKLSRGLATLESIVRANQELLSEQKFE